MADPARRPGPNAIAVLVLLILSAALLLWRQPWQGDGDQVVPLPADAPSRLDSQFRALTDAESESEFVEASGPGDAAARFATRVWRARELLGAHDVTFGYVAGGDVADRPDGSATARVEVTWRGGSASVDRDATARRSMLAFRVVPRRDGGLSIVAATARDGVLPLWLAGEITAARHRGTVVVRAGGGGADLPIEAMTRTARATVGRVVPGTEGDVRVVAPRTQQLMAQLVGQPARDVAPIAAVTTRLGGDMSAGAVIVLNPAVFTTMDRRAAQVVLTHEATHLLTGALDTATESWVVEGFADFVALQDDSAPLSVAAGQILAEVSAGRVPERLPSAADFDAASHGIGAVYESAWLVFRMLGERHGSAEVVRFYDAVVGGASLSRALDSSFDLTVAELTEQWRDYLSKSASTVS